MVFERLGVGVWGVGCAVAATSGAAFGAIGAVGIALCVALETLVCTALGVAAAGEVVLTLVGADGVVLCGVAVTFAIAPCEVAVTVCVAPCGAGAAFCLPSCASAEPMWRSGRVGMATSNFFF